MKKVLHCILFCLLFISCKDDGKNYHLSGRAEKGTLVDNSMIFVLETNSKFATTGDVIRTVTNKGGAYEFNVKLKEPFVSVTAMGYYYNEITGKTTEPTDGDKDDTSAGKITLYALAELSEGSNINLNVITTITKDRILNLIQTGMSYESAYKQAQFELLSHFGLQRYAEKIANTFSITAGNEEAGALLVISAALLVNQTPSSFQDYLNKICTEFAKKGKLAKYMITAYEANCQKLNLNQLTTWTKRYYSTLGIPIELPNLALFIDWNGDGVAGNEIN